MVGTSDFLALLIIPVGVVIIGLVVEYWVIQPLRKSTGASGSGRQRGKNQKTPRLRDYILRLLASSRSFSVNKLSAGFVESVGSTIAFLPILLITSASSIVIILIAVPLFIGLYYSEKLGGCRYQPTCKEYMIEAFELHGLIKGFWLSFKRTMRCNPLFVGGHDPMPAPKIILSSAIAQDAGRFQLTKGSVLRTFKGVLYMFFWVVSGYWLFQTTFSTIFEHLSESFSASRILFFVVFGGIAIVLWALVNWIFAYIGHSLLKRSWGINILFYAIAMAIVSYHFLR